MADPFRLRQAQVLGELSRRGTQAALISDRSADVLWLTGVSASNVAVVVTDQVELVTDGRYTEVAARCGLPVHSNRDVLAAARAISAERGRDHRLDEDIIGSLRMVKDAGEVESLTQACEISCAALSALIPEIAVGQSERWIARRLEYLLAQLGAHDRSFPSIVAAGENSAVPHHEPTDRQIAMGDMLKIDFGAMVDGYHADCTRTFIVAAEPTGRQSEVFSVVEEAARAARIALGPEVSIAAVDSAARTVIGDAGFGDRFIHGLGHGVGLEVHESPLLSNSVEGTLAPGNVVTIEPGVYLPGEFGVRIEDVCQVTESGHRVLTDMPRELIRVG